MAKLSCYEFGAKLLETNDLDPVYVVLHEARDYFDPTDLRCWLLSYWCFYHVGTASWIVDQEEGENRGYWHAMQAAAASKEYPRSAERRHFRGQNATKSVNWLADKGVYDLFHYFEVLPDYVFPLEKVLNYVQDWVGFGPWIAFKVADMLERLDLCRIQFDTADKFLFDSPEKGAELLWEMSGRPVEGTFGVTKWALDSILRELGPVKAPPRYERLINAQEAETVLCKWKSYMGGHYELGEDIEAVKKGLLRFARCKTAQRLLRAGKDGGLW